MEWAEFILRNVSVTEKRKIEVSDAERMNIRKLQLVNTSIQKTEIYIGRLSSDTNQTTTETRLSMDNNYQENMENYLGSSKNMIEKDEMDKVSENEDNKESNFRKCGSSASSLNIVDESYFSVGEFDSSSYTERKYNVSKYNAIDEDSENETKAAELQMLTQEQNSLEKSETNLSKNESYNTEKCVKGKRKEDININSSCENKISKNTGTFNTFSKTEKNCDVFEDNVTGTRLKTKLDDLNIGDKNIVSPINDMSNENILESSKVKENPESTVLNNSCSPENVIIKNSYHDIKEAEVVVEVPHKKNVPLAKPKDVKKKSKFDSSALFSQYLLKKREKKKVGQSVTDLINFFESLNTPKEPCVKDSNINLKRKPSDSEQNVKDTKVEGNKKSVCTSASVLMSPKISSTVDHRERNIKNTLVKLNDVPTLDMENITAITDDSLYYSGDRNIPNEKPKEDDNTDLNNFAKNVQFEIFPKDILSIVNTNEQNGDIETTPKFILSDANIKEPNETVSVAIASDLNAHKCESKFGICVRSKEKCYQYPICISPKKLCVNNSDLKVKRKSSDSIQNFKDLNIKVDENKKSVSTSSSVLQPGKISSKIDHGERYISNNPEVKLKDVHTMDMESRTVISEDILYVSGDKIIPNEKTKEDNITHLNNFGKNVEFEIIPTDILPIVNTNDQNGATETTPNFILPDANIQNPNEIVSEAIAPDWNTHKCEYEVGICIHCKEKCVSYEKSFQYPASNTMNITEHLFVFSDEAYKKRQNSRPSNPRRFRSLYTQKNIIFPKDPKTFSETDNSKNADSKRSKAKEIRVPHPNATLKASQHSNSHDGRANRSYRLPKSTLFMHDKNNNIRDKKKPKTPQESSFLKCFVGYFITVLIFAAFCKLVFDAINCLW